MGGSGRQQRILCVGTAAVDTIAVVPTMPLRDSRLSSRTFLRAGGGPAATAAVTIARQGLPVDFCGVVGRDEAGDFVIDGLLAENVGVNHVERRADTATAQSVILVCADDASRTIVAQPVPSPHCIPAGFDWVHLDQSGYPALSAELRLTTTLSLDDGNPVDNLDLHGLDVYAPTAAVLQRRYGTASAAPALAAGACTVVITDGAAGATLHTRSGSYSTTAFDVQINSTLGAGDVFHGALVAALASGRAGQSAVDYAHACAALSCKAIDGRSGIPSPDDIAQLLQTTAFAGPSGDMHQSGSCR
jgi:sulfofructose kinase